MFDIDMADLDAGATLAAAQEARAVADRAETRLLELAAHWADLHGCLDRAVDGRSLPGMERLVRLGGDGTPEVAEFAPAELGAALGMSPYAAAQLVAAALDLGHRLPRLWGKTVAGQVRPWVARKAAEATRELSAATAALVDAAIARWAPSLSWGRLEALITATTIQTDPKAAAKAARRAEAGQGVWVGQSTDHGIKDIFIRTETPNAIWFDATIDRIADSLAALGDESNKDVRRGRAVGVIAQPQQALNLFRQTGAGAADPAVSDVDGRPPATLYVHLSQDAFTRDEAGVARFEGLGPITVEQAREWLGHCQVTVKPVIDLNNQAPVDAYEIPDRLREAVHLRSLVDVFPYATSTSRRREIDHTVPYRPPEEGGPPGQTRLDNLGPMRKLHHRIKTHGRWQVRQPFNGVFVWRSPHGLTYLVDATGTHPAIPAA